MELCLIFAQSQNGIIGKDNQLPWRLPQDLAHFKALTMGQSVLMGRKTWQSLPNAFRPLPGRLNLVLSEQTDFMAPGAMVVHSLQEAMTRAQSQHQTLANTLSPEACPPAVLWVMGGAQIYELCMPLAQRIEMTLIEIEVEGDAHAPTLDATWQEIKRERHQSDQGLGYSFISYQKATQRS